MEEQEDVKTPGKLVRVCRERAGSPVLECNWTMVRTEPESGNVVCERNGQRIISEREVFEKLNFPGSDDVWNVITSSKNDDDLGEAQRTWAKLDLRGVVAALLRYARKLDPSFAGIQTAGDLLEKIKETESVCRRSMDILSIEIKRAKGEYERFTARTAWENDEKDSLLSHYRDLEDKYAARSYRFLTQLPAWQRLCSAIVALDERTKKRPDIALRRCFCYTANTYRGPRTINHSFPPRRDGIVHCP